MPISSTDLAAILQDADVQTALNASRMISENQYLIFKAIKDKTSLSLLTKDIAELDVNFSLKPDNNAYSRSDQKFQVPECPVRGTVVLRPPSTAVTADQLAAINNHPDVIDALCLAEITWFELDRIALAIFDAANALSFSYSRAEVEALNFSVALDLAAGLGTLGPCTGLDCPKLVVKR